MPDLLVSEEFIAPQGEGINMGRPAYWVRLGGCGLKCKWCDAAYSCFFDARHGALHESGLYYNPKVELKRIAIDDLTQRIVDSTVVRVAITGGEPLLQQEAVTELIQRVESVRPFNFEFETAGVVVPNLLPKQANIQYNVSPKLESSGNSIEKRRNPEAIEELKSRGASFKFVIDTRNETSWMDDILEVRALVYMWSLHPDSIWLMPCGTTTEEVIQGMKILEPIAILNRWNLSARLQVFMHGDERGF
jgi:7-carboxy-7-deazaguanine synthase